MSNLQEILSSIGLNSKEAAIYLSALDLGLSTAQIIAKKALIQRTQFYDLSEKLFAMGLLKQTVKSKKRFFFAAPPEKILEIQEEALKKLKGSLPELNALHNTSGQKPRITYYEGTAGINYINEDTLKYKGEIVGFTTPHFVTSSGKNAGAEYIKKRISAGIRVRAIGEKSPEIEKLRENDSKELRETRILSKEVFNSKIEIGIYGDRVFIADYEEKFGFIIEGSEIARVMKMIFEIVWKKWEV